ncbi:hypothetical protein DP029_21430 [Escherichia coli O148]|nr:hypothetical protein [Escherichia coli O148]STF63282.1 putative EAL domain protein regulator [Escherichia coli]
MSHRARHQLLALPGIIFLVLFPIILSLWIAFLWAKSEVNNQLRTFAQLALDKSELVIRQADLVSDAAERYQGQVCTPAHQKRGNDSNLLIVFYVQIMPDDFVMQLHRF